MPELPEVETVARQLAPVLTGQRIMQVRVFDAKLAPATLESLVGSQITTVRRVGKQVGITVSSSESERLLLIHLRMSGRLLWRGYDVGAVGLPERLVHGVATSEKHHRLVFQCHGGDLLFVDPRRFGTCAIYEPGQQLPPIGLDPLSAGFTVSALTALLRDVRQPLKTWLLRQDRIVGLGNIYASEILFRAGLSPFRAAGSLDEAQTETLHREIQRTLCEAIQMCGTTFSDFQQSDGSEGGFQHFLMVYERDGAACKRCNGLIQRVVQGGRSTYHCERCQS